VSFTHTLRVRYGECDAQGVVFNANWLAFADDAMTEFFRHLGFPPKETWLEGGPFDVMLVHAELDWRAPAGFDDLVTFVPVPTRLGTKSFDLTTTATVEGREVFASTITYVVIDPESHTSVPIPDVLRVALEGAAREADAADAAG
jgi:acyl-CoA thioester hydrolase